LLKTRSHKGVGAAARAPKAVGENATEENRTNKDVTHAAQYTIDLDAPDESDIPRSDLVQCLAEFTRHFEAGEN
jgi:hypothetical protein